MKIVEGVKSYFVELKEDIGSLCRKKEQGDLRKARIKSVAFRVFGGLLAVLAVKSAIFTVVAIVGPFSFLGNLATAVVAVVLAREFFRAGRNFRPRQGDNGLQLSRDPYEGTCVLRKVHSWLAS